MIANGHIQHGAIDARNRSHAISYCGGILMISDANAPIARTGDIVRVVGCEEKGVVTQVASRHYGATVCFVRHKRGNDVITGRWWPQQDLLLVGR